MATTAISKADLIAAAKAQWSITEASVAQAAKGKFEDRSAPDQWSAGDCYRHIIDTIHKIPEGIEQLVKGEPLTALRPGDPDGIANFKNLNSRMLPVEMNTAHGIVWMALQKLTDADLEKEVALGDNKMSLGALAHILIIDHEKTHVEQALNAAGASMAV